MEQSEINLVKNELVNIEVDLEELREEQIHLIEKLEHINKKIKAKEFEVHKLIYGL